MAFPCTPALPGISQLADQLRKRFPETVDAGTLKQLGIAPNNESFLLNIYKFLGVLTPENKRSEEGHEVFVKTDDEFREAFAGMVERAYAPLFELHGDQGWMLDQPKLVAFFRNKDKSAELMGKRQANTFISLAEIGGKRNGKESAARPVAESRPTRANSPRKSDKAQGAGVTVDVPERSESGSTDRNPPLTGGVALAVRIEVNLPASPDQGVYDAIFRSIRQNLIEGGQP